jgi:hypothetical protein
MRSPGLLADREAGSDQDRPGQGSPREPRAPFEEYEVERHQSESGRRMRTRETTRARQALGPPGEELRVRAVAAESLEIARAVHIRDLFEAGDRGRAQDQRHGDKGGAATKGRQARQKRTQGGDRERRESDEAHEPAAALVNEVDRPPGIRSDPGLRRTIVEERIRDTEVEIPRGDRRDRNRPACEPGEFSRFPRCGGRLSCRLECIHAQKLRLV